MEESLCRIKNLAHASVASLEMKMQQYDRWSENFESDVSNLDYRAPKICVDHLYRVIESKGLQFTEETEIIDLAAGTGLVGKFLRDKQFIGTIDAQDGSSGMLDVAKTKNIYSNFYECILKPDAILPLPVNHYDVAILSGALSDSQVHPTCLKDILRHIEVGGIFVFSTRSNRNNLDFKKKLEIEIEKLEHDGCWEKLLVNDVKEFERATSPEEVIQAADKQQITEEYPFISGSVYCYRKLN
ncbi:methyltransferase-like protein 27 [Styela clava]